MKEYDRRIAADKCITLVNERKVPYSCCRIFALGAWFAAVTRKGAILVDVLAVAKDLVIQRHEGTETAKDLANSLIFVGCSCLTVEVYDGSVENNRGGLCSCRLIRDCRSESDMWVRELTTTSS